MNVPPGFEPWRRCDNVIDIDLTGEKHVYNHKEELVYNRSQGWEQFSPSLEDDVVLADLVRKHKRRIWKGRGKNEDRISTCEFKKKGKRRVKKN